MRLILACLVLMLLAGVAHAFLLFSPTGPAPPPPFPACDVAFIADANTVFVATSDAFFLTGC